MAGTYKDVVAVANREYKLHPTESWGTNWGPRIALYQKVTRAYRAAWCASFVQYCLQDAGVGPIADRTAGVWYLWDYARKHGWATVTPRPGCIAILPGLNRSGHTGLVESVDGRTVRTIEGNSGDTVTKHQRDRSEFVGFVAYPVTRTRPARKPPLFQLVVGEGSKAHVVAIGPWGTIRARVPQLIGKYKVVRAKRKWRV